jgi:uncharacterized membrane protein
MKRIYLSIGGLLLVSLIGCTGSGTPGGGSSGSNTSKPLVGTADDNFTLDTPNLATSLKQGEVKEITISIKRGKNFGEDVKLTFSDPPKGVSFEPAAPMIKAGDSEAKVKIKAADDAALDKHTITVTGKPTKGAEAANKFDIKIDKK